MTGRRISLAAGILPEATPAQLVEAAAAAEFDFGGMWVEKDSWTPATTRTIRTQLRDAGVSLLDVEVAWIMPGPPDPWLCELVDIAAELGAPNLLCVSSDPDRDATRAKLQAIVDHAKGTGVRVNLEFGVFTEVKTLSQALDILDGVEGDGKGVLCDTIHWDRSGGTANELASIPRALIGYAQACDAPASKPDLADQQAVIDDAINRRLPLGQGGLALDAYVDALPDDIVFAIEERSAILRDAFPDLNERARDVARTSRAWFDARG